MSLLFYMLAIIGVAWMVLLAFKFAKYIMIARFKYFLWIVVTVLASFLLNFTRVLLYPNNTGLIKLVLLLWAANFFLIIYYRVLARLGNIADYMLTVWGFIMYAFTVFNVVDGFYAILFTMSFHIPYLLFVISLSILVLAPFWAYFHFYKEKSLLLPLFIGSILILARLAFGTIVSHWFVILYVFLFVMYIYIEFIHPYPTLYDKYVFDYPAHKVWGALLAVTTLILLIV